MKRFLLIFAVLGLVACDSALPDELQTTYEDCTVVGTHLVSHRAAGAVAGALVGHLVFDSPWVGGAAGAALAADTCTITAQAPNHYVFSLEASNVGLCTSFKAGDMIQVASILRISYVERDGRKVEIGRNRFRSL